ncbi:MAG: spermidine/putrescine ABC transporter substrate-binding protein [Candidatus Gribaldobacteria bacterium]|nr:spermidine/putrescine ABC transporter substrate-binding protein [Candidatus Gribaldobacteria bacterium]
MKKILIIVIVLLLALSGVVGYFQLTKKSEPLKSPPQELSPVLNVYNWEDYFGTSTIEDFEKEFEVKVNLQTYDSEDTMLSAVQSDPTKYDIIVASDILVKEMINMKLLAQVDMENIPNFKNIGNEFQNPFYDPGNKYSVPYMWGTSGIAINHKYIKETEPSWSILWNPAYKGKISMLNNMQDVLGATLKYLGYSANSVDPTELAKAKDLLIKQKPLLKGYQDDLTIKDELISEELWASHTYSGSGTAAAAENENVEYIIPKEGGFIWVDNLLIPIGAQHKYTAEVFINYILRPEVSAKIANYLWYADTNEAAKKFINPEILQDPALYPSEEARKNLEFSGYFGGGEAVGIYNKIWAELQ